jgi:hypothetical protein
MRQELCDAFPFFRSYQAGLYRHNNVARGVLLDSVASDRDVCGDRVIITHRYVFDTGMMVLYVLILLKWWKVHPECRDRDSLPGRRPADGRFTH